MPSSFTVDPEWLMDQMQKDLMQMSQENRRLNEIVDGIAAPLREILTELKAIHEAVAPKYDIYFSPNLELTRKQKQAMALAALTAMKETEP